MKRQYKESIRGQNLILLNKSRIKDYSTIVCLYELGYPQASIARCMKLSKQRVSVILKKYKL